MTATGSLPVVRVHAGPASSFLEDGERVVLKAADREVLVLGAAGRVFAIGNRCSHLPAQLRRGHVDTAAMHIHCPVHFGAYSLETGEATELPCETPIPRYRTHIEDGEVYVFITEHPEPPRTSTTAAAPGAGSRPTGRMSITTKEEK